MSGANLKSFQLSTKEDYIIYLEHLIFYTHLKRNIFKRYLDELDKLIEDRQLRSNPNKAIPEALYTDINNKFQGIEMKLLNILGDLTTTALSYNKFRKLTDKRKKKGEDDLGLIDLEQDMQDKINAINETRNWSLHIPESLLVAQLKIQDKLKDKFPDKYHKGPRNPILITQFLEYEAAWLIDLYEEKKDNLKMITDIFMQMKKDYSVLIGDSVRIENYYRDVRPLRDMDVPKISFDIQRRKFTEVSDDVLWFIE